MRSFLAGAEATPVYLVSWKQPYASIEDQEPQAKELRDAASVWVLEPEAKLLQLRLENPRYLKRKGLTVPNREALLQRGGDPAGAEQWRIPENYKREALNLLIREANEFCRSLELPDKLPITSSNLLEASVAAPAVSDRLGRFGAIRTERFVYSSFFGNKLSVLSTNLSQQDEPRYLALIKQKYLLPKSEVNTNAAYALATQLLARAFVDVGALERDFPAKVEFWALGSRFVPLYTVVWERGAGVPSDEAARVQVLLPERALKLLSVERPEYIMRPSLLVTNRESVSTKAGS